jgi:protein-disulfide isomerase
MSRHQTLPSPLAISEHDHVRGPASALVTLLEYGDYECPHCGQAHPVVEQLESRLGDEMRFVYRHFPLSQIHPHAVLAAEAAEAAGAQGQFWEMHDMLFANQEALDGEDLARYAASIGLELDRFLDDLATHKYESRVRESFMSGVRSGVNGTPTFFIDGIRFDGPPQYGALLSAMEAVAAEKGG